MKRAPGELRGYIPRNARFAHYSLVRELQAKPIIQRSYNGPSEASTVYKSLIVNAEIHSKAEEVRAKRAHGGLPQERRLKRRQRFYSSNRSPSGRKYSSFRLPSSPFFLGAFPPDPGVARFARPSFGRSVVRPFVRVFYTFFKLIVS